MKIADVPPMKRRERLYDKLMVPVMFVLRGFRTDSLQETHTWHSYDIEAKKIDLKLAVKNRGKDHSRFTQDKQQFLFHAPVIGGWRNFSVYEVDAAQVPFHIGWMIYRASDNKLMAAQLHRLPINNNRIRMLDGNDKSWGYFFAVNAKGEQVLLKKVGSGRIGDGTFTDIRLF